MGRKFVIATDPMTPEQEQAFIVRIRQHRYWHWLPNFWLIKTDDPNVVSDHFSSMIAEIAPRARCFVSEVMGSGRWSARVLPDAIGNKMEGWIQSDWETP